MRGGNKENIVRLGKTISYALRHHPEEFGLKLDREGFVDLNILFQKFQQKNIPLNEEILEEVMKYSDKKRYEIIGKKIRATYGHSRVTVEKEKTEPPELLYHGTARRFLPSIASDGLKPMKRQYVHLSEEIETAIMVGRRRDDKPIILAIRAKEAAADGISFFYGNDTTWNSEAIPPKYFYILDIQMKEE